MTERSGDLSLFNEGPFHRLQVLLRLMRPPNTDLARRAVTLVVVVWLPLVILTAATHADQLSSLLRDYVVYSRMVIAVPALLIGQLAMDARFRVLITHVRQARLLEEGDQQKLDERLAGLRRPRDAALAELIIVGLVVVEIALIGPDRVARGSAWALPLSGDRATLAPAGWYYLVVSIPIYQFLLLLNIWKWLVWSYLLYRLSRMNLQLAATHPDEHGGLGFLELAPTGFIPTAVALAATIGGAWRYDILHEGARLASFVLPAVILLVIIFLLELGPLCFFVPRLVAVRSTALLAYGVIAQSHVRYVQRKWVGSEENRETGGLDSGDVINLALFGASYDRIKRMGPLPIDKGMLIALALSVLVPLFPVVLAEIPISVLVRGIIKAVQATPF